MSKPPEIPPVLIPALFPPFIPALTPAVRGERLELQTPAGLVSFYQSHPDPQKLNGPLGTPLLLVHSVNAAASVAEVAPLYDHYSATRPVYAMDLPGFGFSDRSDRPYTIRLMTDAVLAMLSYIRGLHNGAVIDLLGVSLACEYVGQIGRAHV